MPPSSSSSVRRVLPAALQAVPRFLLAGAPKLSARAYASAAASDQSAMPGPRVRKRLAVYRKARRLGYAAVGFGVGYLGYNLWAFRHPPEQLPQDPTKKRLVILGSGWAATSMLQSLDTENYQVTVISPRNYFLFTPLLPSCTVGTIEHRAIMEPIRYITRHKKAVVNFLEAETTSIDPVKKTIHLKDNSEIVGTIGELDVPYDYLVIATGATNQTFGIPGVYEHACFLKEIWDAHKIRTRLMDCIETAAFNGESDEEVNRLLHMVVVGGGPSGVEFGGELHDFLVEDLSTWYPELAGKLKITLVEALPNVLPMFSKQLIDYTEKVFAENKIEILTKTAVKEVRQKEIVVQNADKSMTTIPYGLLVWATGNAPRPIVKDLMAKLPETQTQRRGIVVDDFMAVPGADGVYAIGDATATKYAPTAQAAAQQGKYLGKAFNSRAKDAESNIKAFEYSHQGSLAYVGSEKAIADLSLAGTTISSGGIATFLFWRSAYLSKLFSLRQKTLVLGGWMKAKLFGRDIGRE